jgi:hypothetical protein
MRGIPRPRRLKRASAPIESSTGWRHFPRSLMVDRETVRTGIVVRTQIHRAGSREVEIGEFRRVRECLIGGQAEIVEPLIAERELLVQ